MYAHDNSALWAQEGRNAAARGDTECPYFPGTIAAVHWQRGWTDAATAAGAAAPLQITVSAAGTGEAVVKHLRRVAGYLRQLGYDVNDADAEGYVVRASPPGPPASATDRKGSAL